MVSIGGDVEIGTSEREKKKKKKHEQRHQNVKMK
jgi:hypothetical protein